MRLSVYLLPVLSFLALPVLLPAQVQQADDGTDEARVLDRIITRTGACGAVSTALWPPAADAATDLAIRLDTAAIPLTTLDRLDLYHLYRSRNEWLVQPGQWEGFTRGRQDIRFTDYEGRERRSTSHVLASMDHARYILSRKPVWGIFYRTPANLWETSGTSLYLKVNPLLRVALGRTDDDGWTYASQYGVRLRGGLDERIYFSAEFLGSQVRFPAWVRAYVGQHLALPGNGLYRTYTSSVPGTGEGYTFLNARGYVGFRVIPHVQVQFGHGRHRIGQGYRSLLLSDFSNNYLYLKILTRVGRFTYQNLFAELSASSANTISGSGPVPKKYFAAHYLGVDLLPNLHFGVFESVVFNRTDHFEFQYLNPVILYRSIEHLTGNTDNVLVGLNADWRFLRRYQLYGQVVLDEFKFREILVHNRGWWGNRYGFQFGARALNLAGVDHLDLQVEYNQLRPYTYQHADEAANYTHYRMPLAHPLGANFREGLAILRWQPARRWFVEGRVISASVGHDVEGLNYGSDLLLSSDNRPGDYGRSTGQGLDTRILILGMDVGYTLFTQFTLQAGYLERQESAAGIRTTTRILGGGFRWNLPDLRMDF